MGHGEVAEMSLTAGEVMIKARLYLKDTAKNSYSDAELYEGINDALRIFAEEAARAEDYNGAFSNHAALTLTSGSVALPNDFIRIKRLFSANGELLRVINDTPSASEFAVKGGSLLSGETAVSLYYYCYPGPVTQQTDRIDVAASMLTPLAKAAAACISGSDSAALVAAQYFAGGVKVNLRPENSGTQSTE